MSPQCLLAPGGHCQVETIMLLVVEKRLDLIDKNKRCVNGILNGTRGIFNSPRNNRVITKLIKHR